MSIHYKFKAAKDFDTVSFDGASISLLELKGRIIEAKGLGKAGQSLDFDLAVHNAQTNEGERSLPIILPLFVRFVSSRSFDVLCHDRVYE